MAVSSIANVRVSATDGDTIAGPAKIQSVKCDQGSGTGSVTLKIQTGAGSAVTVYKQQLAATTSTLADEVNIIVQGGQTLTINLGTNSTAYLYLV